VCKISLHSTKTKSKLGWLEQDKKASTYPSNLFLKRARMRKIRMMQSVNGSVGLQSTTSINATPMPVLLTANQASWDHRCHQEGHLLHLLRYPTIPLHHRHRNLLKHLQGQHLQRLE